MPAGGLGTAALVAGIGGVASLLGAGKSSRASNNAIKASSRSSDLALAEAKRVRDIQDQRWQEADARAQKFRDNPMTYTPYGNAYAGQGQVAAPAMRQQTPPVANAYGPQGIQKRPTQPVQASQRPPQGAQEPMVQMVYPQTGDRSQVKQSQVKHYQDLGAQVVG